MSRQQNYVTRTACADTENRDPRDFYPTPEWAIRALLDTEKFSRSVWEPACGDGAISRVLEAAGHDVVSTDLYDHGCGMPGIDFLKQNQACQNIITNPPFGLAEKFTHHALACARRKVAMLYRLAWLEGQGRYERIYSIRPPTRILVFSSRVHFFRSGFGSHSPKGSPMIAFMWLVWNKAAPVTPGRSEMIWIPPFEKVA